MSVLFEMWFCLMFVVCTFLVRSEEFVDLAPVCHRKKARCIHHSPLTTVKPHFLKGQMHSPLTLNNS